VSTTRRAAIAGALTPVLIALTASPALAAGPRATLADSANLSAGDALLIFAGVPVAVFLVISFLVYLPHRTGGTRYRPNVGWWAAPAWFGGPDEGTVGDGERDVAALVATLEPVGEDGGTSARW
jgi:hypothetical protein